MLQENDQIALVYAGEDHQPTNVVYPHNPNGSYRDIAGICNPRGNVLDIPVSATDADGNPVLMNPGKIFD